MIKEYVSGKTAEDIVFKKDRISTFTFDLASEVLTISISPRLVLAHGEEKEQATVSHVLTSEPAPTTSPMMPFAHGHAVQVPEEALADFNTLKNDIANKIAKFYQDHLLKVDEI